MGEMDRDERSARVRPGSARGRELGEELRRLRTASGRSMAAAAAGMGWSLGKLEKLESGQRGTDPRDIAALTGFLGADTATRDRIRRVVEEPGTGSFLRWNEPSADSLAALALNEALAATVRAFEPLLIPSLLQTGDYARAVGADEEVVGARLERQRVLFDPDLGRYLLFFVHEAALRQKVGDEGIMADQLVTLARLRTSVRVRVRMIPTGAAPGAAVRHGGTLLTFPEPTTPVVYTETDTVTVFQDDPRAVTAYERKFAELGAHALDVGPSADVFARWADLYDRRTGS